MLQGIGTTPQQSEPGAIPGVVTKIRFIEQPMTINTASKAATNGAAPPGHRLTQTHRQLLEQGSAIDPLVIDERDYWTAISASELAALGFAGQQQITPALVLPVWSVSGTIGLFQIRPNSPRDDKDGQPIKYETPIGAHMLLDAHPRVRPMLRDPQIPLYVTEGIRKADAAISQALCCVALLGVTNWRGMNVSGGKTALTCWQSVALNGRTVYIAFDSDSATKRPVLLQAVALGEYLESKGASVQIISLPSGPNGAKVGLDDYFVHGGKAVDLPALAEPLKTVGKRLKRATQHAITQDYIDALAYLGYDFRLNECGGVLEINSAPHSDGLAAKIRSQMADLGYGSVKRMEDAYFGHAYDTRYHPVKDYLNGLVWDGKPHIATLAAYFEDAHEPILDYQGVEHSVFHLWFKRWAIGAVAKVMEAAENAMLALDGLQGAGKSFFPRWLASGLPDYFLEEAINPDDKDSYVRLIEKWLWEVSELGATTRRADVEALKAFITKRWVTVRRSYGRYDTHRPAMASLIGTVNNEGGFLQDTSGNRRYLVVTLKYIDWAYSAKCDPNQVWAEAVALYTNGEPWQLAPCEQLIRDEINKQYQAPDPIEDALRRYFIIDPQDPPQVGDWMTAAAILDVLHERGFRKDKRTSMEIAGAAKRLGLISSKQRNERGYWGIRENPITAAQR